MDDIEEGRIVLARKADSWAGFQWTGVEPEGLSDPHTAELLGARWEGEELVTYSLASLKHQLEHLGDEFHCDPD